MTFLLISGVSLAQTMPTETHKSVINAQMVALVNVSKNFYKAGQSYTDFVAAMTIPSPTFPSQDALFKKVYAYVSTNAAACDILKSDNTVLQTFSNDLAKTPRNHSTFEKVSGPPKSWWQIAINWTINFAAQSFAALNNLPPPPPIDLFPGSNP